MICALAVISLLFIIFVLCTKKISRARITIHQGQLPPAINGIALLKLLPSLLKKGLPNVANALFVKYVSVSTLSFFGINVTFLIGPEVTAHFFQSLDSEISHGNLTKFTVPMFDKEVGHGEDMATRVEHVPFQFEALKPSRLTIHVSPMLQEVESYLGRWGKEGIVDLKLEFERLLMHISNRYLLGKQVQERFDEINILFHDLANSLSLIGLLYPYLSTPVNRRCDRALNRLTEMLSDVVESRKRSGRVEEDTLQKLMDSKYKDGRSTTVAEVVGMSIGLVFAGMHTSSMTSTWTGACLLSHPIFLRAAIEEQEQISQKYKDGIDYNAFMEMDTLHNCIGTDLSFATELCIGTDLSFPKDRLGKVGGGARRKPICKI